MGNSISNKKNYEMRDELSVSQINDIDNIIADSKKNNNEVIDNNEVINDSINNIINDYNKKNNTLPVFEFNQIKACSNILIVGNEEIKLSNTIKDYLNQRKCLYDVVYIFTNDIKIYHDYREKSESYSLEYGFKIYNHKSAINDSYMMVNRNLVRNKRSDKKLFIFDNVQINGANGFILDLVYNGKFRSSDIIISSCFDNQLPKLLLNEMDYNFIVGLDDEEDNKNVIEKIFNFYGDNSLYKMLFNKTKQLLENYIKDGDLVVKLDNNRGDIFYNYYPKVL